MKHKDAIKVVTFWGVNDAVSWLGRAKPLLFDGEDNPKAAFKAVLDAASAE
jgi:endo-1,4-beta-xylanase